MSSTCIITGASGGIGQALCRTYKSAGWQVIATSSELLKDETICDHFILADLLDIAREEMRAAQFLQQVEEITHSGPINCLINNAACQLLGSTETITVQEMRDSFDVNVTAPFALVKALLPYLRLASGSVVNMGSVHAQSTKPNFVAYATSKAALHGLTRALAVDIAPDVRVNTLAPAATSTSMLRDGFRDNPEGYEALAEVHPLQRIATVDEIAELALFLSSDTSRFMTGATIYADGGILSRLHDPA